MELKLLRAFLTVTELRHFGQAAELLCVSQPALSKQIAALEASLGARLFERGRHGAELTTFGAGFLADAQALVRDADEVLARAREASSGARGFLRIGLGLSTLTEVPQLVADFRKRYPNVSVTLNDLSSAEQTRRLLSGKLEVGFLRLPADAGLCSFPMIDEALGLAVPQHARWKRIPSDLNELNEPGFIALARGRGPGLAAQVDRWCAAHRFVPNVIQQTDDIQTVLASVAAGVGAAFLPSRVQYLLRDARVLPLTGPGARWRVGLTWQSARDDAVVKCFVAFVQAEMKSKRPHSTKRS
ncbi:LysR family transcriptional regulator [Paraburkholderia phenoliruptrix]|uniref:Transcriptional regulator, LysR family n=1 Tax=Burkholderia sp. (strain CCGE1003) TaxID=640512 RepID=E1TED3_BURSG|nr:LysR substrate-binding domain-containing protein [Paraburkholderia phenoliruptrix]MBW9103022.1 LysR family transcriptional regulator [Paraburkholderia phenoliruptrix]MBW9127827.1 LysR family transcriptional regulator [Paraburkholderia ginsengiterrae]